MTYPLWVWIGFNVAIVFLLILDLLVLHRDNKPISIKHALFESSCWISLALLFNVILYLYTDKETALDFLTGYLIEKSLSIDNLFVFILIFNYFKTPKQYHHPVLFWGILGAIIMRALFIFFGIALVHTFSWILYVFGAFLFYAGIQMAFAQDKEIHPENNLLLRVTKKWIPFTATYRDGFFFVIENGKRYATPLFLVLMTIEATDVLFALDSIPAIMAITLDPFIIYTSNIFAILGLRSLYFALAGLMPLFCHLHYGLAAILCFVGAKMLLDAWIHIPIGFSLGFIALAITASIAASLLWPQKNFVKKL